MPFTSRKIQKATMRKFRVMVVKSPHASTGPDHDRMFECTVQHEGLELARGSGKSKKAAESDAALAALKKLREESGSKS